MDRFVCFHCQHSWSASEREWNFNWNWLIIIHTIVRMLHFIYYQSRLLLILFICTDTNRTQTGLNHADTFPVHFYGFLWLQQIDLIFLKRLPTTAIEQEIWMCHSSASTEKAVKEENARLWITFFTHSSFSWLQSPYTLKSDCIIHTLLKIH